MAKRADKKLAETFRQALSSAFPGVEFRIMPETMAGADYWVRAYLRLPPDSEEASDLMVAILEKSTELDSEWFEKYGVSIIVTVTATGTAKVAS